ncbi:PD-(D/E)XK nuclease superfamily protein [Vibrio sp. 10N.222.49.C12]|uniref:PD-(D/E)XK nuclease superfamily protein n=1 Tax=Vibrio sp. 10N.222.49.C12 TaxID=3229614 RepID=UPI0035501CF0
MCRKDLLKDISEKLQSMGFTSSNTQSPFTYQSNVKYPSIFADKSDYAHYIVYTPTRTLQIVAKYQESTGTTIEKLGYTALDAARTEFDGYLVVCGGGELLKHGRAIDFLNAQKHIAPRLHALRVQDLQQIIDVDSLVKVA